jgi:hypothetical protein
LPSAERDEAGSSDSRRSAEILAGHVRHTQGEAAVLTLAILAWLAATIQHTLWHAVHGSVGVAAVAAGLGRDVGFAAVAAAPLWLPRLVSRAPRPVAVFPLAVGLFDAYRGLHGALTFHGAERIVHAVLAAGGSSSSRSRRSLVRPRRNRPGDPRKARGPGDDVLGVGG